MKIAFYNGSDGVYRLAAKTAVRSGGATKQQWLLARVLADKGHRVVFITPSNDPGGFPCEADGIRFVRSPCRTVSPALHRILASEKPDWLYWRTNSIHIGPCFFMAKKLGIGAVYACALDDDCVPKRAINPFSLKRHFWPLYEWGLCQADRILVQHPGQMRLLPGRHRSRARRVNNIMPVSPAAGRRPGAATIAWVGNLRFQKRPDLLVEIIRRLPRYRFVVCGAVMDQRSPAGFGESIVRALSDLPNADYRGATAPGETIGIIARSSLLLSTSDQEGFPNTMLEAWSAGVPVISLNLDIGGLIPGLALGRVTRSVPDTVSAIREMMQAPAVSRKLGENGRRYVSERHSAGFVYGQFMEALRGRAGSGREAVPGQRAPTGAHS